MSPWLSVLTFVLLVLAERATSLPVDLDGSSGGGWSGNGGGLYQVNDNVWYLGPDPIRYCLRTGTDFPVAGDEARALVARSFDAWRLFFSRYHVGSSPRDLSPGMSLQSQEVSCGEHPELEFYLGLDNEAIRSYRDALDSDGYGLALRRAYEHKLHRHQGYVWIPSFSRDTRKIEHMLLHELGHVFGMKHDTAFVMDRDVALFLKSMTDGDPASRFLAKIEADFWPFDLSAGSKVKLQPYSKASTCPIGTLSLAEIPAEFHPVPMPLSPCVRLTLQKNSEAMENNFQLNMDHETGNWLLTIFGTFRALEPGNEVPMVPGTLSTWQNAPRAPMNWIYVPYGHRMMHAQLSGYFIRGQTRYPVKMSWNRGLLLEIFIPAQARWWTIRSYRGGQ